MMNKNLFLMHHGIKGQKWGIRRFQDYDGHIIKKNNYTDIVKKGTTFYRMADTDSIDSRRKYVSVTEEDRQLYKEYADQGALWTNEKNLKEFTYTATKDLLVANGEQVCSYVLDTYGDKSIKDFTYSKLKDFNSEEIDDDISTPFGLASYEYDKNKTQKIMKFYQDTFKNYGNEILSHFKENNYDAIVDGEDYIGGTADYPLILLNPKDTIKYY